MIKISWCLLGLGALPWWLPVVGSEPVKPLISPAIIPLQEQPEDEASPGAEFGFPGAAAVNPEVHDTVDGPEGALADADDFSGISPASDGAIVPFAAEDVVTDPDVPELSADLQWQAPDTANGDFANDLGRPSAGQRGFPGGMSQGDYWPRGFAENPGNMHDGGGWIDDLQDGLGLSLSLSGTYDSNPSRGYGGAGDSGGDDFFMTLGGSVNYLSRASTWTYGARYSGGYNQYYNQSEHSGYFHNAGASLNYTGGPLTASFDAGIDFGSGANRYYESVVDEIRYNYGLNARYRFSRKTSLTGSLSQRHTRVSGNGNLDTDSLDLGASALWQYSPLLEIGPGIRYTRRGGGSSQDRTSIGPTLTVNYELSKKISLNSRVGMDFAEYDNGESADPTLFTSIGLNYQASQLWSMNLSLLRDSQASYTTPGEFDDTMSLRLGYNRKIRRAVWSLGIGWETRSVENADATAGSRPDRDYLTIDTSLGMPVFRNTCNASVFIRYSDHSAGRNDSWDSLQTGFIIRRSF